MSQSTNNELTKIDYDKLINLVDHKVNDLDIQVQCCKLFQERNKDLSYYETAFKYYTELKRKLESHNDL